jgi:hypothetical protein
MEQTNEVLNDMLVVEGNLPTGHRTTIRTGLPDATWRLLNYGVANSKSQTAQVTDSCGMLEAYAEVDKDLADLNGNAPEWRLSEDRAFLESMNQEMARVLFTQNNGAVTYNNRTTAEPAGFYGDSTKNPERFVGFPARYPTASTDATKAGYNVTKMTTAGAAGANTSAWFVTWGANTVHGIVPKGSSAGFKLQDLGEQTLLDAAGGKFQGYRTHYQWKLGLSVRDWRYVSRVANINTAFDFAGTANDLIAKLVDAEEKIPALSMGRTALYVPRKVFTWLRQQILLKTASTLTWETVAGKRVMMFDGIPVRRTDGISLTVPVIS